MKREIFYITLSFAFLSFYPAYSLEASHVEHKGKLVFSPASGENNSKPQIDCSAIRGVCHRIEADDAAKKHLAYGKRVGLNTIRFWMSPRLFASSGEAYVKKVVDFVRVCHSCGYKVMPILFNGNMLNPDTIMPESYEAADKYAAAFINALKDEPGLLMFDMMNLCDVDLVRVDIVRKSGEAYFSKLVIMNGDEELQLDSRTSDSVALAVRYNAPIYVEDRILEEVKDRVQIRHTDDAPVHMLFDEELDEALQRAIASENYERAQEIKNRIKNK
jgi:bifunctional DNase/RNase